MQTRSVERDTPGSQNADKTVKPALMKYESRFQFLHRICLASYFTNMLSGIMRQFASGPGSLYVTHPAYLVMFLHLKAAPARTVKHTPARLSPAACRFIQSNIKCENNMLLFSEGLLAQLFLV